MEIDCYSMKSLKEVTGLLGYSVEDYTTLKSGQIFKKYYGIYMSQEVLLNLLVFDASL